MDRLLRRAVIASAAVHVAAGAALYPAGQEASPLPVLQARLLATPPLPSPVVPVAAPPAQTATAARPAPRPPPRRNVPVLATAALSSHSASAPAAPPAEVTAPVPVAVATAVAPAAVFAPPRYDVAYLANPPPPYPPSARRRGIEGTATVEARVGPGGDAREVRLATSAGNEVLDQAALEAVRGWRFVPARRGDLAVEAWVRIPLVFRLD